MDRSRIARVLSSGFVTDCAVQRFAVHADASPIAVVVVAPTARVGPAELGAALLEPEHWLSLMLASPDDRGAGLKSRSDTGTKVGWPVADQPQVRFPERVPQLDRTFMCFWHGSFSLFHDG